MDWSFLTNMFGGSKDAANGAAPATTYYSPGSGVVGPSQTAAAAPAAAAQPSAVASSAGALTSAPATASTPAAGGTAPAGGGSQSGMNYGAMISGGLKGIGHGIGKYAMAGAENTPIPQTPQGYTPVLASIDYVPPTYRQPVGA